MFFRDNQTVTYRVFSNNHYKCTVCAEYIYTILHIKCNIINCHEYAHNGCYLYEFGWHSGLWYSQKSHGQIITKALLAMSILYIRTYLHLYIIIWTYIHVNACHKSQLL